MHADLSSLAFLLGTWRGKGKGDYPSTDPFTFAEEMSFSHAGKPHLVYVQRSWNPESGQAMHSEMGFWRPRGPGYVEIALAYPIGVVDVEEGTVIGQTIDVATTGVAGSSTAKEVRRLERTMTVEGDVLRYELRMSAIGEPLVYHADAELRRVE